MRFILGSTGPEQPELFTLELRKIATFDFVYYLASTDINQSVPNLIKMFVPIRSCVSSIMGSIGLEEPDLFALEL